MDLARSRRTGRSLNLESYHCMHAWLGLGRRFFIGKRKRIDTPECVYLFLYY
jgi:hypothetical protein